MAHKFADEIMQQFTGERGPFDSRITFVSTRDSRLKDVYVMSLDEGDSVVAVVRVPPEEDAGPPPTPSAAPGPPSADA